MIEEAKETFELRRASILDKAFRGELSRKWRRTNVNIEDAEILYSKIKQSKRGKRKKTKEINVDELRYIIPSNWKWVRLGDVFTITSGGTPKRTVPEFYAGNIPWVKTGEIKWNYIYESVEKITPDAIANSSAKILPKNSVLVAMYGQGLTRGRASILGVEATCNQAVCALLPNDYILPDFLYYYFMEGYQRFRQIAKGGNQENLSATVISEFIFPLPPLEEQGVIVDIVQSIFTKESMMQEVIEMNIDHLKQSILSKAFRGELGTSDPSEENAIELLKEVLQEQVK
nr:restriction endonuclease subunit S [Bacillus altitudinis]